MLEKFSDKFENFIKLATKLPKLLQIALLPIFTLILLLLLLTIPVLVVYSLWQKSLIFWLKNKNLDLENKHLKKLEQLIKKKKQQRTALLSQVQTMDEAVIIKIRIENELNKISGVEQTLQDTSKQNNLLEAKIKIDDIIQRLRNSKEDLQQVNAQINEISQKYFSSLAQSELNAKLPLWLASKLPEDWRCDLEELRQEWIYSGCSEAVLKLKTTKCLLEMLWATIQIKWDSFIEKSGEVYSSNLNRLSNK